MATFAIDTTRSGKVILQVNGTDWAEGLVTRRQSDGKIIVGGTMNFNPLIADSPWDPNNGFDESARFLPFISRWTTTGEPDITFGAGGFFFIDFPTIADGLDAEVTDIIVRPDGKMLFAFIYFVNGVTSKDGIALLTSGGMLEPGFGTSGVALFDHAATGYIPVERIALLSDGSIILASSVLVPQRWMTCRKLTALGAQVNAFATNSLYIFADNTEDTALVGLHVDADDKVYLLGQYGSFGNPQKFVFVKIDGVTGAEDEDFGTDGAVTVEFGFDGACWPLAQMLERDDQIIAAGWAAYNASGHNGIAVCCIDKIDGSLVTSFGTNSGKTLVHGGPQINDQTFGRVFFDADGKIVLAGQSCSEGSNYFTPTEQFIAVRLTANGIPDTSFSPTGFKTLDIDGSGNQDTYGGALDGDKYLFSGHVSGEDWEDGAGGAKAYLMRTSAALAPDVTFGQLSAFAYGSAPEVTTDAASSVLATTAAANATIDPNGSPTYWRFVYGTVTGRYVSRSNWALVGAGTSGVGVTASLTGLTPGTAYYGRAIGYSGKGGITVGDEITFTTS